MKAKDLKELGIPSGILPIAFETLNRAHMPVADMENIIRGIVKSPEDSTGTTLFGDLAKALIEHRSQNPVFQPRSTPAPYKQWGDNIEDGAIQQMKNACQLPISVSGALMPDGHQGYGLPIGGVLATDNAVIPYAVGVDIACRMKITALNMPVSALWGDEGDRLAEVLEKETRFGAGANFQKHRDHEVMDDGRWKEIKAPGRGKGRSTLLKDLASQQLGTSGGGNHFVEFGIFEIREEVDQIFKESDLGEGMCVALLSHSGSRGPGKRTADYYSKLAMDLHPELPEELKHLAWLDLDTEAGQEYWEAMQLMGKFAAANHDCIHRHIIEALGVKVSFQAENHHNFAWKERHDGREVIVHRKGATPAGKDVIGVIPGTMADDAYIVSGLGNKESLESASHGAGRAMSRKAAREKFNWHDVRSLLGERGVRLLSSGLDECPMAYKKIKQVMEDQIDLVRPIAKFSPKIVKMAPDKPKSWHKKK